MIVQKYGGRSLGSVEKIEKIAGSIVERVAKKDSVVIVVSAMGEETDNLVNLARRVSQGRPPEDTLDRLLVTGEEKTAALLTMAIKSLGRDAEYLTGEDIKLETDEERRIKGVRNVDAIERLIGENYIVVVTGFQGLVRETGQVVTLGRGGSDLTAIALAAALGSGYCENFTDVDGIYTVDPRIVPSAKRFEQISYNQLIQVTGVGGGKLMDRAVILAQNLGVKIRVLVSPSIGESTGGTLVGPGGGVEEMEVQEQTGLVTQKVEQIRLRGVPNRPGAAAGIFSALQNINIVDSVQSTNEKSADVTLFFLQEDKEEVISRLENVKESTDLIKEVGTPVSVTGLTLVSPLMKERPNYFARILNAIYRANVNVESFSSSSITILVTVRREDEEKAAQALAEEFQLIEEF